MECRNPERRELCLSGDGLDIWALFFDRKGEKFDESHDLGRIRRTGCIQNGRSVVSGTCAWRDYDSGGRFERQSD
jgi:hypothetical protein